MTSLKSYFVVVISALVLSNTVVVNAPSALADEHCPLLVCYEDDEDAIIGQGSLFLDDTFTGSAADRGRAAACEGCEWKLLPRCVNQDGPGGDSQCLGFQSCPQPANRFDVFFRETVDQRFREIGSVCIGPGGPVTGAEMQIAVRDRFIEYLPDANPSYQPPDGAIVNLATIFDSGQPKNIGEKSFDLLGFEVVVTAEATWRWHFDAGVEQEFAEPGGKYPDKSVTYTYTTTGTREVTVDTTWGGQFTVDGFGPFEIAGPPITQTSPPLSVPVREAESELIDS